MIGSGQVPLRDREYGRLRSKPLPGDTAMTNHRRTFDQEHISDLPDELRESIESESSEEDLGDETQANEERETEEGIEQTEFIEPSE
jgi:hypothetical protein